MAKRNSRTVSSGSSGKFRIARSIGEASDISRRESFGKIEETEDNDPGDLIEDVNSRDFVLENVVEMDDPCSQFPLLWTDEEEEE